MKRGPKKRKAETTPANTGGTERRKVGRPRKILKESLPPIPANNWVQNVRIGTFIGPGGLHKQQPPFNLKSNSMTPQFSKDGVPRPLINPGKPIMPGNPSQLREQLSMNFCAKYGTNANNTLKYFSRLSTNPFTELKSNRTKDLGRWKASDDLALLIGIKQTGDFRSIYKGTKFSCHFNLPEIQQRWKSLLLDPSVSEAAVLRFDKIHPDQLEKVKKRALFSPEEEHILNMFCSSDFPTLQDFQDLLDEYSSVFFAKRTAKNLQAYWHALRDYDLLDDQKITPNKYINFMELDFTLATNESREPRNPLIAREKKLESRSRRRQIRYLEDQLTRLNILVDSLQMGKEMCGFDNGTFALLRGHAVRFQMRSYKIVIGRSSPGNVIDLDLSLETPTMKISRRHSEIELRPEGKFFITNIGKNAFFVNGVAILQGEKHNLYNDSIIEIGGLPFVFIVNKELIKKLTSTAAAIHVDVSSKKRKK